MSFTEPPLPTLAYGQRFQESGFHMMQTPSDQWLEMLTGVGATGVEVMLAVVAERPLPGHPLIPVLQAAMAAPAHSQHLSDLDALLTGDNQADLEQLLNLIGNTLSRTYIPRTNRQQNVDFQITRGVLGVSL
jgi:altronate dehydratase